MKLTLLAISFWSLVVVCITQCAPSGDYDVNQRVDYSQKRNCYYVTTEGYVKSYWKPSITLCDCVEETKIDSVKEHHLKRVNDVMIKLKKHNQ